MSREWKPGDVAMVELPSGGERASVMIGHDLAARCWHSAEDNGDLRCLNTDAVAARPLAVIDPEDREQVEGLFRLMLETLTTIAPTHRDYADAMQAAFREFANPTPPRIEEPETWGVVEASCVHSDERREWVKFPSGNWHSVRDLPRGREDIENPDDWDSLVDPALIREGVQA